MKIKSSREERQREAERKRDQIRVGTEAHRKIPRVGGGRKLGGEIKWLRGGGRKG